MIDVDKIIQEQAKKLKEMPEKQKQNAVEMMIAFGNFMNCFWKNSERKEYGQNK